MSLKFVNKDLQEDFDNISPELKYQIDKRFAIAEQIQYVLDSQNPPMNQRDFAKRMGKGDPEICKWLSGFHNFTENTIASIEFRLDTKITVCAKDVKVKEYYYVVVTSDQLVKNSLPKIIHKNGIDLDRPTEVVDEVQGSIVANSFTEMFSMQ